jgi:hypothetical protein
LTGTIKFWDFNEDFDIWEHRSIKLIENLWFQIE